MQVQISDGCEPSWIVHLNLGLKMLKQLGTTTKVDSDIRSFCEMYFVAHEVMGRTAWQAGTSENEDYAWAMNSLDEVSHVRKLMARGMLTYCRCRLIH